MQNQTEFRFDLCAVITLNRFSGMHIDECVANVFAYIMSLINIWHSNCSHKKEMLFHGSQCVICCWHLDTLIA